MRATIMHRAGDVRIENVPDPTIKQPTDAIIRVTRACICGSDLWPYNGGPNGAGWLPGDERARGAQGDDPALARRSG